VLYYFWSGHQTANPLPLLVYGDRPCLIFNNVSPDSGSGTSTDALAVSIMAEAMMKQKYIFIVDLRQWRDWKKIKFSENRLLVK
jgi:hypothetical protein